MEYLSDKTKEDIQIIGYFILAIIVVLFLAVPWVVGAWRIFVVWA